MSDDFEASDRSKEAESNRPFHSGKGNLRGGNSTPGADSQRSLGASGTRDEEGDQSANLRPDWAIEGELMDTDEARQFLGELRQISAEMHSGPIPSAREMERYERSVPGISRDIIRMAQDAVDAANDVTRANAEVARATADSIRASSTLALNQQRDLRWICWAILVISVAFAVAGIAVPAVVGTVLFVAGYGAMFFQPRMVELFNPESRARNSKADGPAE
ncbi:hypothetical protein G7Y31_02915 [Corynebacterium lizhenjunii]|uniref:DUF2335 domain-containing protein n=1 Tax=Corynebacterium lizhenjunii TaxID=2709394 RepID=A0A7T0KF67_9CORY|nr:hypothetical protein [Corynebacterium lizhenjunii]QPK79673.1 hypothetical protein G7Y31_02915 [Corynebacterium lizhenjunii]